MKKNKLLFFAFILLLGFNLSACSLFKSKSAPKGISYGSPEASVQGFFDAVVAQKYDTAWASLTKHTQGRFVSEVAKEEKTTDDRIQKMFDNNELPIQRGFWTAFRDSSKAEELVKGATYSVKDQSGDKATVNFNAENGAVIPCQVFKEGDGWKFGYAETFNI